MKYSIIYPYYKRPQHTLQTLNSLVSLYPERLDYEIVFVVDLKNTEDDRAEFFEVLEQFWHKIRLVVISNDLYSYSASRPYNIGVKKAIGEFIILSNPECVHRTNILAGFDAEFEKNKDVYIVCACDAINPDGSFVRWLQHSTHINRGLHFCSAISKDNYLKNNGFDEDFVLGLFYEDNDWKERVEKTTRIITRDDLLVSHMEHPKNYIRQDLIDKNIIIFNRKNRN